MKNFKKNIGFAVILGLLAGVASSCANDSGGDKNNKDDKNKTTTTAGTGTAGGTTTAGGTAGTAGGSSSGGGGRPGGEVTVTTIDTSIFVGTWKVNTMTEDGTDILSGTNITFVFTKTTYVQNVNGSVYQKGTYKATAEKATLTPNDPSKTRTIEYTLTGSTMVTTQDSNGKKIVTTFKKQ